MTRDDAEDYLGTYRVAATRWALMLSGMADSDAEATQVWLQNAGGKLDEIGSEFPDLAPTADRLRGLREHHF